MTTISGQVGGFGIGVKENCRYGSCSLYRGGSRIMMSGNQANYTRVCGFCGLSSAELKTCGRCKAAWYCSLDHQKEHWQQHKLDCIPKNGVTEANKRQKKRQVPRTDFSLDKTLLESMTIGGGVNSGQRAVGSSDFKLQFQTNGNTGGRRRKSLAEPDLSTPIDSSTTSSESTTTQHQRPRTPAALCQVQPVESKALEEYGFTQDWFVRITDLLMKHLSECGVCVVDNFLGAQRAEQILHEVEVMHSRGIFQDGQVVSRHVQDQARGMIRGDKITWVTGSEPSCTSIGMLASIVDTIIARANTHPDARCLAQYKISWRTRAMVACYPGGGTHYVKHVDNPNGDGRCITAIYYVNKDWTEQDGGVLRIYPEGRSNDVATIEPLFDRMLFFWSDRRNPHEVLPATGTRYAITVWYLDQREREEHLARVSGLQAQT